MSLNEAGASVVDQFSEETGLGEEMIQDVNVGRDALLKMSGALGRERGKVFNLSKAWNRDGSCLLVPL